MHSAAAGVSRPQAAFGEQVNIDLAHQRAEPALRTGAMDITRVTATL